MLRTWEIRSVEFEVTEPKRSKNVEKTGFLGGGKCNKGKGNGVELGSPAVKIADPTVRCVYD